MEVIDKDRIENHFIKLEAQKTILSTCTDLYKSLSAHFNNLERSLDHNTEILDFKIQDLDSDSQEAIDSLQEREVSISARRSFVSAEIEAKKQAAISEFSKPKNEENEDMTERLKSLCKKMDSVGLLNSVVKKRKGLDILRNEMSTALRECVDPQRLILDVVEGFLKQKAAANTGDGSGGLMDSRLACGMVVSGLFPPDELKKEKRNLGPSFAGTVVERASRLVKEWKRTMENNGDVLSRAGPSEAATILQLVVGFGLMEKVDQEFLKKLVMHFAVKRDIAKLAVPVFGEKLADIIYELVKNKKEIEAVYLISESGFTNKFKSSSLLNSYVSKSKKSVSDILKNGKLSTAAVDESNRFELSYIKAVIKCVEDNKLEAQFSLNSLKKQLSAVEKAKAHKKKGLVPAVKPSPNKRGRSSGSGRSGGPPPPVRSTKIAKTTSSFTPISQQNLIAPPLRSPATRYNREYDYPTQCVYEGSSASAYGTAYSLTHIPTSASLPPPHYSLSGDTISADGTRLSSSIGGLQAAYGSYIYTADPSSYQPPLMHPSV